MEIKKYNIHGIYYYTVRDVYEELDRQEESDNRRTWVDGLIRQGKIPTYRFSKLRLVDEHGLKMIIAFRDAVRNQNTHLLEGSVYGGYTIKSGRYKPQPIPELYSAAEVIEKEPKINFPRLVRAREEKPECAINFDDAVWGYLPCAIEAALNVKPLPRTKPRKAESEITLHTFDRPLLPLTAAQRFAYEHRKDAKNRLSFKEIARKAFEEGISDTATAAQYWQEAYRVAVSKIRAYKAQYGFDEAQVLALQSQREIRKAEREKEENDE